MTGTLTLQPVREAVSGSAAAYRRRCRLQPTGGTGDLMILPTLAGAGYATERPRHLLITYSRPRPKHFGRGDETRTEQLVHCSPASS